MLTGTALAFVLISGVLIFALNAFALGSAAHPVGVRRGFALRPAAAAFGLSASQGLEPPSHVGIVRPTGAQRALEHVRGLGVLLSK